MKFNMVSERYHASAANESDEDSDDSDSEKEVSEEEESSLCDEDEATAVLDSCFIEFGSFYCDHIQIKPIKQEFEDSTIKIGEISINSHSSIFKLKANGSFFVEQLSELTSPVEDGGSDFTFFEATNESKELVTDLFEKIVMVPDHSLFAEIATSASGLHRVDIGTGFGKIRASSDIKNGGFIDFLYNSGSDISESYLDVVLPPVNVSWFSIGESSIATFDPSGTHNAVSNSFVKLSCNLGSGTSEIDIKVIRLLIALVHHGFTRTAGEQKQQLLTTAFVVESHVWSSNSDVWIAIFDPGGTVPTISPSVASQHRVFDPGGNRLCSPLISPPFSLPCTVRV